MKSAAARDVMVARVAAAYEAHPDFVTWPVVAATPGRITATMKPPFDQASYIAALHEICALGEPEGRVEGTGTLSGERVWPDDDGKVAVAGSRLLKAE